jgi:hypothetical protein
MKTTTRATRNWVAFFYLYNGVVVCIKNKIIKKSETKRL